jgi:hypothetical protein
VNPLPCISAKQKNPPSVGPLAFGQAERRQNVADLVRIRVEELVVIFELQVDSVRQIAVRTGGVGTVRMNVPVERLRDRGLNGRQRLTIEVLLLLELRDPPIPSTATRSCG